MVRPLLALTRRGRRARLAVAGGVTALLGASLSALPLVAASAATPTSSSAHATATPTSLTSAFAQARHLPGSAVGGIQPGSLRTAKVNGTEWAVASFAPAASAASRIRNAFQDGASKGVFVQSAAGWTLVPTYTDVACTPGIPAAVKTALGLTQPGQAARSCATGAARPSAATKAAATKAATDTGSLPDKIVSIALSQVGEATNPSESGFSGVDCDPYSTLDAAFSPNANGCGPDARFNVANQNETWCSDFAKWVWAQAGVTQDMNTLNAAASSFYTWGLDDGQKPAADTGTPVPGDAIVFYEPGAITNGRPADHVGIVTAVHPNGTIDMVNGDFAGPTGITAEYDQNIDVTPWASTVWANGEQWVLVAPPTAAQHPVPVAAVTAPHAAVVGTTVDFSAYAGEAGGSIASYYWTFNDGRDNNVYGQHVSHVFQRAGFYTVTVTVTSNFGTVTVKTWNVGVSAPGSAISSVPNPSVWYNTVPVMQYEFTTKADGGIAVDSWDGASWLQQIEPGQAAAGSALTGLTYADAAADYATVPHGFYRTPSGALGETYLGANGWTSATLPGSPAANSAITALAVDPTAGMTPQPNVTPEVFFFDAAGKLNVSSESNGTWTTSTLGLPPTRTPGSLTAAIGEAGGQLPVRYVAYLNPAGHLTTAMNIGGSWVNVPIFNQLGVQAGSAVSAATTDDGVDVFFTDGAGKLAVAHSSAPGVWSTREIAGTPAAGGALVATGDLSGAGAVQDSVFYLTAGGMPAVTTRNGTGWQATALPGTATAINGVSSNVIPGTQEQLFLTNGDALSEDTASAAAGTWNSAGNLPTTPTTYPGTVLLYAATPADQATALAAATYAGLPASQVTTNFAFAWGAVLSGDYLVIGVGGAANNALYDNPCGWSQPSQDDPGSTPFNNVEHAVNVPLTNLFEVGLAATASQQQEAVNDLAYYAAHGSFPAGETLPALGYPGYSCLGTAS